MRSYHDYCLSWFLLTILYLFCAINIFIAHFFCLIIQNVRHSRNLALSSLMGNTHRVSDPDPGRLLGVDNNFGLMHH